jgi:hypothetical protein
MIVAFMTIAAVGPSDTLRHWVPADLKHIKLDANRPEIRGWGEGVVGGGERLCIVRYI